MTAYEMLVLAAGAVSATWWVIKSLRLRKMVSERRAAQASAVSFNSPSQFGQPKPPAAVVAFTPTEREALGINETDSWIRNTDSILNGIEWDRMVAG